MGRKNTDIREQKNQDGTMFSRMIRAGMRSYFIDVMTTVKDEFYITLTESIKRTNKDRTFYEKHKIFIFEEDFEKISEAMSDTFSFIDKKKKEQESGMDYDTDYNDDQLHSVSDSPDLESFKNFEFEDLDK